MENILLRGIEPSARKELDEEKPEYEIKGDSIRPLDDFKDLKTKVPFKTPLAVQKIVIPYFLHGINIMVRAFTGSGKTLAYCLPLVEIAKKERMFGLVLVPSKALVGQVLRVINEIKSGVEISAMYKNNGRVFWVDEDEKGTLLERGLSKEDVNARKFHRSSRVLIATPDSLLDIIDNLNLKKATHLVIDEADFLLSSASMDMFISILNRFRIGRMHFSCFSATTNSEVDTVIDIVGDITKVYVKSRKSIDHEFVFGTDERIKHLALLQIVADGIETPVLIFVKDEVSAKRLGGLLDKSRVYGENDEEHGIILDEFRLKKIWYLFTTDVLSRGVDFYNIKSVVNYDIPDTKTQFVHRAGRVNRNCQGQKVYTIYTNKDFARMGVILEFLEENNCAIPEHIGRIAGKNK